MSEPVANLIDDVDPLQLDEELEEASPLIEGVELEDVIPARSENFFWNGSALTSSEASALTLKKNVKIIVIAGSVGSGKTTLIGSLFLKFQLGQFDKFLFAGSRTLMGFEERSYHSLQFSGNSNATTERTSRDREDCLLHLAVSEFPAVTKQHDMLFYDVTGEAYEAAQDSTDAAEELLYVRRSTHFVLLLDGERLNDIAKRNGVEAEGRNLLESLLAVEKLTMNSRVDVVFSKKDIFDESTMLFLEKIKNNWQRRYSGQLGHLSFYEVAARPTGDDSRLCIGMKELFRRWVTSSSLSYVSLDSKALRTDLTYYSELDRFIA